MSITKCRLPRTENNPIASLLIVVILSSVTAGCLGAGCFGAFAGIEKARVKSDQLMIDIGEGNALAHFSTESFDLETMPEELDALKTSCDFRNRKGGFVTDVTSMINGKRRIGFVYDFELACDTLRFTTVYTLTADPELVAFNVGRSSD